MLPDDIDKSIIPAPLTQIYRVFAFQRNTGSDLFKIHELIVKKPMREQDLYLYEVAFSTS